MKVTGFQSLEIEGIGENTYQLNARKPDVVTQPAPPKIRRKKENQVAGSASQNAPASNPWANLGSSNAQ